MRLPDAAAWVMLPLGLVAACAQPPSQELRIARERVARAAEADAALFAPDLLSEAERALAEAERLVETEASYRRAVRSAAQACLRADEAFAEASTERRVIDVRLRRLVRDIGGLLQMAASRGAREAASSELGALEARFERIGALAKENILEAHEEAVRLKPEALAFEQRFRP